MRMRKVLTILALITLISLCGASGIAAQCGNVQFALVAVYRREGNGSAAENEAGSPVTRAAPCEESRIAIQSKECRHGM